MIDRRTLLAGLGGLVLAGGAYAIGAYRSAMAAADARLARRSSVIATEAGPLEYAVAGEGPPVMMIHGTGGGFDQGLMFAAPLVGAGFGVIAPSRFGYLRSAYPDDPSSENCIQRTADPCRGKARRSRLVRAFHSTT